MSIAIKTVRNVSTIVIIRATVEFGAFRNLSVNNIDWIFGDIQIMWETWRQCEQQFINSLNSGLSKSMEHSPLRSLRSPNQSRNISAFYETPSFIHGSYGSSRRNSQWSHFNIVLQPNPLRLKSRKLNNFFSLSHPNCACIVQFSQSACYVPSWVQI